MTHHKAASERDEHIALRGDDRVAGDVGAAAPDIAAEFSQRKSSKPRIWKAIAGGWHCSARAGENAIGGIGVTLLFGGAAIRDAPDRYRRAPVHRADREVIGKSRQSPHLCDAKTMIAIWANCSISHGNSECSISARRR
jgi:hypothetical protein